MPPDWFEPSKLLDPVMAMTPATTSGPEELLDPPPLLLLPPDAEAEDPQAAANIPNAAVAASAL